jgi:hypothetical protein
MVSGHMPPTLNSLLHSGQINHAQYNEIGRVLVGVKWVACLHLCVCVCFGVRSHMPPTLNSLLHSGQINHAQYNEIGRVLVGVK